ncbi:uncharacterized protein LOC142338084 [Convolutriloba macropyga]|uniref:uncharacterized protein LOC142338084 n=1 Tax=Convolutriloba macropyga TaxID=536237 RepID=UPI003F523F86
MEVCYIVQSLTVWLLVICQMIVIDYGLPEGMLSSEKLDGDTEQALMDLQNLINEDGDQQNDISQDNRIEDMYSLYSKQSEKKSSDISKEGEGKNGEPEESEEELTEDVKDLLNELLSDVLGEFDGNVVDNTGGNVDTGDDNDENADTDENIKSESVDEMVEDEENVLEEQMGFKENKAETDKQTVQLVDFMNDQIVDAIVEENSTVFTNKTANETIVIVEDKVTLVNETEGSKGQIISEEEEANEIELEGVFDPSKECGSSNPCTSGFYCPNEGVLRECTICKKKNQQCLTNKGSNSECCGNGMENDDGVCYFGKCKRVGDGGVKRGERGTHCNNISQCAENHCCRYMQSFSANVCDRESQEGEQCLFDPDDMGSDPDNYGGAIEIIAGSSAIKMSEKHACRGTQHLTERNKQHSKKRNNLHFIHIVNARGPVQCNRYTL